VTDDNSNEITEPRDDATGTAASQDPQAHASGQSAAGTSSNKLGGLMGGASGLADATTDPSAGYEVESDRAAENTIADGEQALEDARRFLTHEVSSAAAPIPSARKKSELVLLMLLGVNVLAIAIVAMLPLPVGTNSSEVNPVMFEPMKLAEPIARPMSEPFNRALLAAEAGDFAGAVDALEQQLASNPRMHLAERLNVVTTASYYALRNNDFQASLKYAQLAQSLQNSQSSQDQLERMAEAAVRSGDQEAMRRTWARFMLQQRQMPSLLYKQIAQAYLQLSDGYSKGASDDVEAVQVEQLKAATDRLRSEVVEKGSPK
jgi:tetratricopeptide (TPR) repeat protein